MKLPEGRLPFVLARMALATWLGVLVLMWAGQDLLVFPGVVTWHGTAAERTARATAEGAREVVLHGADGAEVVVWHFPVDGERAVLVFHGNGTAIAQEGSWVSAYRERGYDVVLAEYRGYLGVPGWPSESALVADAHVAWTWVTDELQVPPSRIVVHGESLGGGVACALAAETSPAGLVLVSTFDSLESVAAERNWYLPVRWLIRTHFASAERLAGTTVPTLIAHSRDDFVVPFARGEALAAAIPGARFLEVDGTRHGALTLADGVVAEAWAGFVDGVGR